MAEGSPLEAAPTIRAHITPERIDVAALLETIGSSADGAVTVFIGRVRDTNEGRSVAGLTYEAYEEMAQPVLQGILEEAKRAHEVGDIVAVHRTGALDLGDVAVAVLVSAPHRAAAYEASRFVIEEIKAKLPIWKFEAYSGGTAVWQ